jgi:hypothetical protein
LIAETFFFSNRRDVAAAILRSAIADYSDAPPDTGQTVSSNRPRRIEMKTDTQMRQDVIDELHMHGSHQRTYDAFFQHPVAHNLEWRAVKAMLESLCDHVEEENNGHIKFTRNGQTLIVHVPKHKDFSDVQELMHVRHFLENSASPVAADVPAGKHVLVVIDHREARIFETEMHGSVPHSVKPFDPMTSEGPERYLHSVDDNSNGQRKPELKTFYEAVARKLQKAGKILLFGCSTGASSAMDHLIAELKKKHPVIAERVIGTIVVDEQHMTDDQLLAEARKFYAVNDKKQLVAGNP